jgi:hypothetical protein
MKEIRDFKTVPGSFGMDEDTRKSINEILQKRYGGKRIDDITTVIDRTPRRNMRTHTIESTQLAGDLPINFTIDSTNCDAAVETFQSQVQEMDIHPMLNDPTSGSYLVHENLTSAATKTPVSISRATLKIKSKARRLPS